MTTRGIAARSDETRSGSAEGKSPARQGAPETDGMTPKETLKMEQHVWSSLVDPTRGRECQLCGDYEYPQFRAVCPGRQKFPRDDNAAFQRKNFEDARGLLNPVSDDWTPCPRTVRACIEALPSPSGVGGGSKWDMQASCKASLEALLPQPNPAKALWKAPKPDHGELTVPWLNRVVQSLQDHVNALITSGHYQPKGDGR